MSLNVHSGQEKILLEPYEHIAGIPGKGVRSTLLLAFQQYLQIPQEKLEAIGEVVSMLHTASLMIDDIQDNSKLRRGVPVAHLIFGVAQTINSANYVYFLAMEKVNELSSANAITVFSEELCTLHRGQGMDIYWRDSNTCPTEEEYGNMVKQKTGGLFRLAVRLMQACSEDKRDYNQLLDDLGLYYQVRDDYVNLTSTDYMNNKSFCEDFTEGKFSFPIIHGIRNSMQGTQINSILKQRTEEVDLKKYALKLLEKAGSFEYTREYLNHLETKLRAQIAAFGGNKVLEGLLDALCQTHKQKPDIPSN
eukprot:Clim_evm31s55 gene=Clim_evmTU31s55